MTIMKFKSSVYNSFTVLSPFYPSETDKPDKLLLFFKFQLYLRAVRRDYGAIQQINKETKPSNFQTVGYVFEISP